MFLSERRKAEPEPDQRENDFLTLELYALAHAAPRRTIRNRIYSQIQVDH